MKKRIFFYLAFFLILGCILSAAQNAYPTLPEDYPGMTTTAKNFVGRLLCLVKLFTPPIILVYIVIGGIKYVMSDDASQQAEAKKSVMDALIGAILVAGLLGAASSFGIELPSDCYLT